MKIESVTLRELQMPLVHFFETSFGRVYGRRIILVSVEADGVRGWGECVAGEDPFFSSEWIETAWATMKHYLAPTLLERGAELEAGSVRRGSPEFAGTTWPKGPWRTRCGTPRQL